MKPTITQYTIEFLNFTISTLPLLYFSSHPQTELLLSSCNPKQFPCDSGQCVPQEKRCDQRPDCSDETDERNCTVVNFPSSYDRKLPPPTSGDSLSLLLSVEITSVRNFDLVGFKVALDLIISMEWKDTRLEFFNLRGIFANRVRVCQPRQLAVLPFTHSLNVVQEFP